MAMTEMMPKFPEKKAAPLRRLPLLFLKSQAWIGRGSESTNYFLQVPQLKEMRQGSPLLPILLNSNFLMLWTHKFADPNLYTFNSFPFG
jgi:hypothetical protein